MPTITIEVTPDIALKIRELAESGFFSLKTGNCSVNLLNGKIKSIKTEVFSYPQKRSTMDSSEPHATIIA